MYKVDTKDAKNSRYRRTAARAKARKIAARDERLKRQIHSWFVEPLRNAISANERYIDEAKDRFQSKVENVILEFRKLQHHIQLLENGRDANIKEQVSAVMLTCRTELEEKCSNIERDLNEQSETSKKFMEEFKREQSRLRNDLNALTEKAGKRLNGMENAISDYSGIWTSFHKLEADFSGYVSQENQRETYTKRLEILVKDMEGRNWPWRPNMDRSPSPNSASIAWASHNSSHDAIRAIHDEDWRPWSTSGPVKPSPPSSRPSSARYKREQATKAPAACSAGSGASAARSRPSSARGRRQQVACA